MLQYIFSLILIKSTVVGAERYLSWSNNVAIFCDGREEDQKVGQMFK